MRRPLVANRLSIGRRSFTSFPVKYLWYDAGLDSRRGRAITRSKRRKEV